MNIADAFPGTYLKAPDLKGRAINIAMHSVSMEEVGSDHKPVLFFCDANGIKKERGMVLNKTNATVIAEMYGWETDQWAGKVITIYPARVEFAGKIVDGIRVKLESGTYAPTAQVSSPAPVQTAQPAPAQMPPPVARNGAVTVGTYDDEIPF